jgi:hypothetical protein
MLAKAVQLRVVTPLTFECSFWMEDDGWTGSCPPLLLNSSGATFEQAKSEMIALIKAQLEMIIQRWSGSDKVMEAGTTDAKVIPFRTKRQES